uniref:Dynein light chain n=1 Tax=Araucaria cunninghamii TaxID=56994 RepID=A0A0D6R667_ARACU
MEIIEVCERTSQGGAHHRTEVLGKNRLFTLMEKYYSFDGVRKQKAKRLSQSPLQALSLSEKIGRNCSKPPKKKVGFLLPGDLQKPREGNDGCKANLTENREEEKQRSSGGTDPSSVDETQKLSPLNVDGTITVTMVPRPSKAVCSPSPAPILKVNLAISAMELKVKLRAADMPPLLQERAFRCARQCLDDAHKPGFRQVALTLKKEFDTGYGPAWQCIVGKSFGSFVTHSPGGFLYFSIDKLSILLFKTTVEPIDQ